MRPITLAPMLSWKHFFQIFYKSSLSNSNLGSYWHRPDEYAVWFSRSTWSLACLVLWHMQLTKKSNLTLWVPDFFCNSALVQVRVLGVKLVFYPLNPDMSPNIAVCEDLVKNNSIDIFLHVHYFGRPINGKLVVSFCRDNSAWCIEDATHVIAPMDGIGEFGDCVMYSPYKFYPIPDGAVFVVRKNGPGNIFSFENAIDKLIELKSKVIFNQSNQFGFMALWLIKKFSQSIGLRRQMVDLKFKAKITDCPKLVGPKMSKLSELLLKILIKDISYIKIARTNHFKEWADGLSLINIKTEVPSNYTPYLATLSFASSIETSHFFERLRKLKIPFTTWPDLPPEISSNRKSHSFALYLRETNLYLPIHQSILSRHISKAVAQILMQAVKGWSVHRIGHSAFQQYWRKCKKNNLLQSWEYGVAKEFNCNWEVERYLITDNKGKPVSLAQVMKKNILFFKIARLNRGPLLLINQIPEIHEELYKLLSLHLLRAELTLQKVNAFIAAPELSMSSYIKSLLIAFGFYPINKSAWSSGLLNLTMPEAELLGALNGKWRNQLRKGQKSYVHIECHRCQGIYVDILLNKYEILQKKQKFLGLSSSFIRHLSTQTSDEFQMNIFVATCTDRFGEEPIGLLVTAYSGDTATYLISTVDEIGRNLQVNSVLLWESILHAKRKGCKWFDVGGMGMKTPTGVNEFKKGLNSTPYSLVGEWVSLKVL
jgi:hypothetical protein